MKGGGEGCESVRSPQEGKKILALQKFRVPGQLKKGKGLRKEKSKGNRTSNIKMTPFLSAEAGENAGGEKTSNGCKREIALALCTLRGKGRKD